MRKYLYAGAMAGGLLLLGAAPAHADTIPAPINAQQGGGVGDLLGPDGGLGLDNPLGGAKVLNIDPGTNTPDLTGAAGGVLPDDNGLPAARTGLGQAGARPAAKTARPAAGTVREDLPGVGGGGLPTGSLGQLPIGNLLGGGLLGNLLPGGVPSGLPGTPRSAAGPESRLLARDLPLLGGGLGGLLPASPRTLPAFSGWPAGGTPVAASDVPATDPQPATQPAARPAAEPAQDPATAGDARLHEEPIDPEGKAGTRTFSDGRPVAGVDSDYK
jgi:hypothetical protein